MVAPPFPLEGAGTGAGRWFLKIPAWLCPKKLYTPRLAIFNGKGYDSSIGFGGYFAFFRNSPFLQGSSDSFFGNPPWKSRNTKRRFSVWILWNSGAEITSAKSRCRWSFDWDWERLGMNLVWIPMLHQYGRYMSGHGKCQFCLWRALGADGLEGATEIDLEEVDATAR